MGIKTEGEKKLKPGKKRERKSWKETLCLQRRSLQRVGDQKRKGYRIAKGHVMDDNKEKRISHTGAPVFQLRGERNRSGGALLKKKQYAMPVSGGNCRNFRERIGGGVYHWNLSFKGFFREF